METKKQNLAIGFIASISCSTGCEITMTRNYCNFYSDEVKTLIIAETKNDF